MSATLRCPHPPRCGGARSHRAGSAAAIACARATTSRPTAALAPAPVVAVDTSNHPIVRARRLAAELSARELLAAAPAFPCDNARQVGAALREHFAAQDLSDGWNAFSGQPHPTGGYLARVVRPDVPAKGKTTVIYNGPNQSTHRADGPAWVVWDERGQVVTASWHHLSSRRREDGPAHVEAGLSSKFRTAAGEVALVEGRDATAARFLALSDQVGLVGAAAMGWLRFEAVAGRDAGEELIEAGMGWQDALDLAQRGTEEQTMLAVARGELPMSWAVAGT